MAYNYLTQGEPTSILGWVTAIRDGLMEGKFLVLDYTVECDAATNIVRFYLKFHMGEGK